MVFLFDFGRDSRLYHHTLVTIVVASMVTSHFSTLKIKRKKISFLYLRGFFDPITAIAKIHACHMRYQLRIYSTSLILIDQSESQLLNPALWLVHQFLNRPENSKLASSVPCKDSNALSFFCLFWTVKIFLDWMQTFWTCAKMPKISTEK